MTLKSADTLLEVLQFADSHGAIGIPELGIVVTYDSLRQQVLEHGRCFGVGGNWPRRSRGDCTAEWLARDREFPRGIDRGNGRPIKSGISV